MTTHKALQRPGRNQDNTNAVNWDDPDNLPDYGSDMEEIIQRPGRNQDNTNALLGRNLDNTSAVLGRNLDNTNTVNWDDPDNLPDYESDMDEEASQNPSQILVEDNLSGDESERCLDEDEEPHRPRVDYNPYDADMRESVQNNVCDLDHELDMQWAAFLTVPTRSRAPHSRAPPNSPEREVELRPSDGNSYRNFLRGYEFNMGNRDLQEWIRESSYTRVPPNSPVGLGVRNAIHFGGFDGACDDLEHDDRDMEGTQVSGDESMSDDSQDENQLADPESHVIPDPRNGMRSDGRRLRYKSPRAQSYDRLRRSTPLGYGGQRKYFDDGRYTLRGGAPRSQSRLSSDRCSTCGNGGSVTGRRRRRRDERSMSPRMMDSPSYRIRRDRSSRRSRQRMNSRTVDLGLSFNLNADAGVAVSDVISHEEDPKIVALMIHWIYNQNFENTEVEITASNILLCWLLADSLQMPRLQNDLMALYIEAEVFEPTN